MRLQLVDNRTITTKPWQPTGLSLQFWALLKAGSWRDAVALMNRGLMEDDAEACYERGELTLHGELGFCALAVDTAQDWFYLAAEQGHPIAISRLLCFGPTSSLLAWIESLECQNSPFAAALAHLSKRFLHHHDYDEATYMMYVERARRDPATPRAWLSVSQAGAEDYGTRLARFDHAVSLGVPRALTKAAEMRMTLTNFDDSVALYDRAADQGNSHALRHLVHFFFLLTGIPDVCKIPARLDWGRAAGYVLRMRQLVREQWVRQRIDLSVEQRRKNWDNHVRELYVFGRAYHKGMLDLNELVQDPPGLVFGNPKVRAARVAALPDQWLAVYTTVVGRVQSAVAALLSCIYNKSRVTQAHWWLQCPKDVAKLIAKMVWNERLRLAPTYLGEQDGNASFPH